MGIWCPAPGNTLPSLQAENSNLSSRPVVRKLAANANDVKQLAGTGHPKLSSQLDAQDLWTPKGRAQKWQKPGPGNSATVSTPFRNQKTAVSRVKGLSSGQPENGPRFSSICVRRQNDDATASRTRTSGEGCRRNVNHSRGLRRDRSLTGGFSGRGTSRIAAVRLGSTRGMVVSLCGKRTCVATLHRSDGST